MIIIFSIANKVICGIIFAYNISMKTTQMAIKNITQFDILQLRDAPVAKMIKSSRNDSTLLEEWTYYNESTKTKEYYFFKDGRLVSYKGNANIFT